MIIVKLIGGIGNQMFQYALGRNLALKNNTDLKIDITGFEEYKLHAYSLGNFNILEKIATSREINQFKKYAQKKSWYWWWYNRWVADESIYIKEKKDMEFQFDQSVMKVGHAAYLDGYWQNEKYFREIAPELRKEFVVKKEPSDNDKKIMNAIIHTNSVSIHIRRKDYVTDRKTNAVHGTCDADYYQRATALIAKKLPNPHFFIFSDDHGWVKKNTILNYPATYVDHNEADRNFQDLRLMSACRHAIIANSSFSWWGAWLITHENKIIIAPKQWVANPYRNTNDITLPSWIRI